MKEKPYVLMTGRNVSLSKGYLVSIANFKRLPNFRIIIPVDQAYLNHSSNILNSHAILNWHAILITFLFVSALSALGLDMLLRFINVVISLLVNRVSTLQTTYQPKGPML